MSLDNQINGCEQRIASARARKNSREVARLVDELKGLRIKRLRRDKRRGLFKAAAEQAAVLAMFGAGAVLFCLASPIDAYAATGPAPSDHYFPWKPLAAWILLAMFIGWAILKRSVEPVREDDDDPYRHAARETDEDRFRRAWSESDGDHKSYVNYRRGKK